MLRIGETSLHKHLSLAGHARWFRAYVALVFLVSVCAPVFSSLDNLKAYAISKEVENVIGKPNRTLSAKFSHDQENDVWQFNKNGIAALAKNIAKAQGEDAEGVGSALSQLMAKQVGGGAENDHSLYSVDLPADPEKGITYYDNVTRLSFTMVPDFSSRRGKLVDGRVVYPFMDGAQIVYTAKSNGLKEDIVLTKPLGDRLYYNYDLKLPETLEARLLDDGSIGIYSANPALFGNLDLSSSSLDDRTKILTARKSGNKDHLVFGVPAPFIQDQNGRAGHTKYLLNGNRLTVVADGLDGLSYPLTIDPSITVTSSSDFEDGTSEDSISFGTSGQIERAQTTGGTPGAFTSGPNMTIQRALMGGAVHNGYLYAAGAWTNSITTIDYAKIQPDGSIGAWTEQVTGIPSMYGWGVATYNGYIYLTGGRSTTPLNTTYYAKINPDGSLGTIMTASNNFNTGRYFHRTQIYNGYIYVVGGRGEEAGFDIPSYNSMRYAKLKANGDIEPWISGPTLPQARLAFAMVAHNDRMYVIGGFYYDNSPPFSADKVYTNSIISSKINADGSLAGWTTTVASISGLEHGSVAVYAGYMYVLRGSGFQYAPIRSNGSIGEFVTITAPPAEGNAAALVAYNGFIYKYGGGSSGIDTAQTFYARIDPAGSITPYAATTDFDVAGNERHDMATVVSNGHMYILGGDVATGGQSNTVRSAPINADGSLGTWVANTSFPDARIRATAVTYGNYIYLVGGQRTGAGASGCTQAQTAYYCQEVLRATINPSNGVLTWSGSYTYSTQGRSNAGSVVVNGYLYVLGGRYSNNSLESSEVNFAKINDDGTLGAFNTTQSMLAQRSHKVGAVTWGGRIYVIGGWTNSTSEYAVPNADGTIPASGAGTWTYTGGNLPNYLQNAQTVVNKGYIYVTGGANLSFVNGSATTQITKINEDGTLSGWSTSNQAFTQLRFAHGSVAYKDYLYVLGGCRNGTFCTGGNVMRDVQYTRINNGDNGDIQSWNATSTSLGTARATFGSFAYGGYLYVIGGKTTTGVVTGAQIQQSAPISADGVVGPWSSIPNPPSSIYGDEAWAFHNGYIYRLGGKGNTNNAVGGTEYAAVCTGSNTTTAFVTNCTTSSTPGTLSSWNAGTSMNTGRSQFAVVAHNGYLYALGGCTSSNPRLDWICTTESNSVEVSQINSTTRAPGSWSLLSAGNNFTNPRFKHQAVAYNGYIYVIGGCANIPNLSSACDADLSDVQVAKANGMGLASNAGCGAVWCTQNAIVNARMDFGAAAHNGYLYITGGDEGPYNDVRMAPIAPNGSLGKWARAQTDFTTPRRGHATVANEGNLYVIGGTNANASTYYADVQFAGLKMIPRISKYSKLLTVSPTTEIASVHYNGLLNGDSRVIYRVAPSDGVFSSFASASQGTGSEPDPLCGLGSIYYVQLMVTLNDTTTATFPESGVGNVTDVTTYYRMNATPPPDLRLHGGKWFYLEQQRPLDICKQ